MTDAALVVGPALHAFGWSDADLDAIAGAVVAGHVIECGAQCCGGNYAFFEEVPGRDRIGFPLAELQADGSSVITKHPGTGGMVTVGTVTAQLLYEIGGPRYLSPDAVARFDSIELSAGRSRPGAHRGGPGRAAAGHAEGHGQPRRRLAQLHDAGVDRRPGGREGPVRRRRGVGRDPRRARRLRRDGGGSLRRPDRRRHGVPAPRRARRRRAGGRPGLLGRRRRDQPVQLPRHVLHLGALGGARGGPLLADHGRRRRGDAASSSATANRSR